MSRTRTILFVDDNAALREAFARLLEREGYHVVQASSGSEGLDLLQAGISHSTLIISDMVLPEPDGRAFLSKLAQLAGTTPVLLISGYPREEAQRRVGIIAGPHFLSKPFGVQELLAKVRELVGGPGGDGTT